MSNRNILKGVFTIFENETGESREIDTNDLVAEKIRKHKELKELKEKIKHQEMLDAMTPEELEEYQAEHGIEEEESELAGIFTDFDSESDDVAVPSVESSAVLEEAREEAEAIIAEANAKAQEILNDASSSVEAMKEQAIKEGQKQGYDMGQAMAMSDMEAAKADMQVEIDKIRQEYIDKEVDMEQEVLDVVCDVVQKVFMIQFSDKRELLLHLCEKALTHVENSKQILIKVNERNNEFLKENKESIQSKVGEGVQLDIIMVPLLEDDKCIIETDGGIFDCSIGVELDNFIKDLKSLSI